MNTELLRDCSAKNTNVEGHYAFASSFLLLLYLSIWNRTVKSILQILQTNTE